MSVATSSTPPRTAGPPPLSGRHALPDRDEGAEPLLLSVDELRAASRLAGVPVPPLVADDDPDDPRIDLAALRGLAARGLVVGLAAADPDPAGELATALAVLDEPAWLLDVEIDRGRDGVHGSSACGTGRLRRWNHVEGRRGTVMLTTMPGGCVQVDPTPDAGYLARLVESCGLIGGSPADEISPSGFEVDMQAHVDADAHALEGDLAAAKTVLVAAGADAEVARRWVEAVDSRCSAAAVRAVRRLDGGAVEMRELRWLVGGDGQAWRVDGGDSGEGDLADEQISRVQVADSDELRVALADLLPPAVPDRRGMA